MYHKGIVVAKGSKKEIEELAEKLEGMSEDAAKKYLDDLAEGLIKEIRKNAFVKWAEKFEKKFHLHFDGKLTTKSKKGIESLKGTEGHNHSVIGENLQVRKYLTQPNWNIERVKEEVALIYEQMVKSGKTYHPQSINRKFDFLNSKGTFRIQIEFDELGNLTNAYPLI